MVDSDADILGRKENVRFRAALIVTANIFTSVSVSDDSALMLRVFFSVGQFFFLP
jgi:hypothetical protein